jgi:hypothetical protein
MMDKNKSFFIIVLFIDLYSLIVKNPDFKGSSQNRTVRQLTDGELDVCQIPAHEAVGHKSRRLAP